MLNRFNFGIVIFALLFSIQANAQQITIFYPAANFDEEPDRFGNVYQISPMDAILQPPIGDPELEGVLFEEDNLWAIWNYIGNNFLISHGPGFWEDAPELTAEITMALGGRYEVILNFLENDLDPGTGPIQAALGDEELQLYDANNSVEATGGTGPAYPFAGGTAGEPWWYSVSLGEVDVESGGVISVRVDDIPGDQFDIEASPEVGTVFQGITLRVHEVDGSLPEFQVSPGVFELTEDISGNQFFTGPADEAAYPNQEDWITVDANEGTDNLWNIREGLGPYGPILESFPQDGEDAPPLMTSVIFAAGGTYEVYFSLGDIGESTEEENLENPTPLQFGLEGEELQTYVAGDGNFRGAPGYNDYEIFYGEVTVEAGEQFNFIIDDAPEYEAVTRSVYLGMRFVNTSTTPVNSWALY